MCSWCCCVCCISSRVVVVVVVVKGCLDGMILSAWLSHPLQISSCKHCYYRVIYDSRVRTTCHGDRAGSICHNKIMAN